MIFLTVGNVGLLPIAPVEEGEMTQVCLLLSCETCEGTDTGFSLNVELEITNETAGKYNRIFSK